ncbi:MAG TPA: Uma2 family endonuclease [Cyanobacteria bacterium UBA11149]|nr:Uma2 family endonuclease [Cyanobacteria bacterium UBA11367]HBE59136.1 Uma2 family endonuclease [Cyanobacteria bacterium UBA11366]HBK64910.1 Uma2 family endonuclease [Cyanobacteria bacterium UBA11166]HBR73702.1 Uma2 family endonuclease [Cyanobacteria bacterium UBA11159]HBS68631.1 Uma2 family endonuclease [Cyanobacteria bacterium UBA11153]HBW87306.1 Uma2 family endonuclease [Cyanobacteria bacterium UBA11149]HCA97774.1 Uma2 family endonuclease [Cyanobacteria bacterium UBA9226]
MVQTSSTRNQPRLTIPPLENGDRLSRDEFETRYQAMPHIHKAELIEGIVFMAAALRFYSHGRPHNDLNVWLGTYRIYTPGTDVGDAPTVRLDEENEPQPDLVLLIQPNCGGRVTVSDDDYIEGAPELVAEISASTASIDLGAKKKVYQRHGVQEYIVWRVLDGEVDWFCLDNGKYLDLKSDDDGITRSRIFPGLWLDKTALLNEDMQRVLAVLQSGIASVEHQAFVARLNS